jgi:hypothetical protein
VVQVGRNGRVKTRRSRQAGRGLEPSSVSRSIVETAFENATLDARTARARPHFHSFFFSLTQGLSKSERFWRRCARKNTRRRPEINRARRHHASRGVSLTRRRRIRVRPETGRQLRRMAGLVTERVWARGLPSAGRGVAGSAGPRTPGQSTLRGAVAHRNAYRPGLRGQTSAASARPTDTPHSAMPLRGSPSLTRHEEASVRHGDRV